MSELILKVLARAGQTIQNPFAMGRDYVRPKKGEIRNDFRKVGKDMGVVGKDMARTVQRELQRHDQ